MAKSKNNENFIKEQSLIEHTEDLLKVYDKIVPFLEGEEDFQENLKTICVLHDLGKMNSKFQKKIEIANEMNSLKDNQEKIKEFKNEYRKIDDKNHNILSGAFLKKIFDEKDIDEMTKTILYKAVMLHHGNYLKYICKSGSKYEDALYQDVEVAMLNSSAFNVEEVEEFIEKVLNVNVNFRDEDFLDYDFLKYLNDKFVDSNMNHDVGEEVYMDYIIYKGFLNLIDHIASTQMLDFLYVNDLSKDEMDSRLMKHLLYKSNEESGKIYFNELQQKTRENENSNLITTAFTGSGKTIADYRWGGERKVYLVPNKISAESFYFDALHVLNEDRVGILHGDISLYVDNEDSLNISLKDNILTKNLAKPYTIATVDQYLISMFKYPGYEKTFASIYNSNITVDEVHLLTPRMFLILIYFIEFASKYLNARFHLMTATMPKIYDEKLSQCGVNFTHISNVKTKSGQDIVVEMIKEKDVYDVIDNGLKNNFKILIVKNTILEAMEFYQSVKKRFPSYEINLLHSRFKLEDKKNKYSSIRKQEGDIWIATQMVEVSLDLDFQMVISDSAPMDSIIQRMGRCNRHDTLENGLFYILDNYKNNIVYSQVLKEETYRLLKDEKLLTLERRKELLEEYYDKGKVKKYYENEFKNAENDIMEIFGIEKAEELNGASLIFNYEPYMNITDNRKEADILFRNLEMDFKVILEEDYEDIRNTEDKKEVHRKIQENSIPISRSVYYQLLKDDVLNNGKNLNIIKKSAMGNIWNYDDKVGLRKVGK